MVIIPLKILNPNTRIPIPNWVTTRYAPSLKRKGVPIILVKEAPNPTTANAPVVNGRHQIIIYPDKMSSIPVNKREPQSGNPKIIKKPIKILPLFERTFTFFSLGSFKIFCATTSGSPTFSLHLFHCIHLLCNLQ